MQIGLDHGVALTVNMSSLFGVDISHNYIIMKYFDQLRKSVI